MTQELVVFVRKVQKCGCPVLPTYSSPRGFLSTWSEKEQQKRRIKTPVLWARPGPGTQYRVLWSELVEASDGLTAQGGLLHPLSLICILGPYLPLASGSVQEYAGHLGVQVWVREGRAQGGSCSPHRSHSSRGEKTGGPGTSMWPFGTQWCPNGCSPVSDLDRYQSDQVGALPLAGTGREGAIPWSLQEMVPSPSFVYHRLYMSGPQVTGGKCLNFSNPDLQLLNNGSCRKWPGGGDCVCWRVRCKGLESLYISLNFLFWNNFRLPEKLQNNTNIHAYPPPSWHVNSLHSHSIVIKLT